MFFVLLLSFFYVFFFMVLVDFLGFRIVVDIVLTIVSGMYVEESYLSDSKDGSTPKSLYSFGHSLVGGGNTLLRWCS